MHIRSMKKLRDWMREHELNDAGLAAKLDCRLSRSQVNRIRRGESRPSIDAARELERVTGIPAASFVMGDAA